MLPVIFFGFLLMAVLMAVGTVVLTVRALTRRPLLTTMLGASAGALLAVAEEADAGAYAVTGGAVAFALAMSLRSRKRLPRPAPRVAVPAMRARAAPLPIVLPISRPPPSLLDIAWDEAADLTAGDPRVAAARARCHALLARASEAPGDPALDEWADIIRRRVPELVDAAAATVADATPAERATLPSELAEALERVGTEAAERLDARRRAARDQFDSLRGYVRSRTAPDRDWL